ncbi:tRNA lysidine(34) synthetase TilS [Deinococcus taeanensis]|uniref:tRNA lysidine(34) synthetase TilS n=1 Tax=Deinococcus taeanensis TaxID=2737050 RepID=UPI001CDB70FF|nr:tRNA lysidine(34) synthetase TilS [Deinococcus taeanensis]UBV41897.1 tRNA lysidine(34) synthetase TilS [Deinococcus taeanensis]
MPVSFESLLAPLRHHAGQRVVVGVSGGADSVALLRALLLVGALPIAAHLDHALRGDSAQDAAWVEVLAAGLGVPFTGARVNVGAVARRRGWNVEDAARRIRYDFLGRAASTHGAPVILTAHTLRDQAETVLNALLRGEAVLHGIPAERGRVRRPWLNVPRGHIEAFLRELNQDWRDDPTNADPTYTRAWLRREVMPLLEARHPALQATLARVARHQAQDDAALSAQAAALTPHTPPGSQPPAVLRRWLRARLRAAGLDVHAGHLDTLTAALTSGHTTHLDLPGAHPVTVTGGRLHLTPQAYPEPDFTPPPHWKRRTRQPGDRVALPGGTRKLSDVLTDRRVPRADRDRVPLLVSDHGVQWVGLTPPVWAAGAREAAGAAPDPLHAAMGEALTLARDAAQALEVPVGAVILGPDGAVIGRGRNSSREHGDMTRHAELAALRDAARTLGSAYLSGCTLVVTLEPCPMCLGAALEARVAHVVYGAPNPRAGALGGVTDLLAAHWGHAPTVTGGVREGEAARLLRNVFGQVRAAKRGT